jgi:hypothetical protein
MKYLRSLFGLLRSVTSALVIVTFFGAFQPMAVRAATEYNERISFVDDYDGCSGERIRVDGVQHIVGHVTTDANGGLYYVFTRNTKGKGVGQSTGDQYIMTDAVAQLNLHVLPGDTQTLSQEYHTVLIHQGESLPDDDTIIHFLSRVTVNANGDVTSSTEIQNVECR